MSQITEIFILKMTEGKHVDAVREAARQDFVALDRVTSWETLVTTDLSRPTLFAEIFTFPDHATAKQVTPLFAERLATKAFLNEIDEMVVGQFFAPHSPQATEKQND